jgi:hypothetical protein
MTKLIASLPDPDGSLLLRELNQRVNNELASNICMISGKAVESDNVAVKAALFDMVELPHGYADVHKALRLPRFSSSWEVTVPRKVLNTQIVNNIGGSFAGDR